MIDLKPVIRSFLLADEALTSDLPDFYTSKPIFTRRPAPAGAEKPYILISVQIGQDSERDLLGKTVREKTHYISTYGLNTTGAEYRRTERIARRAATILNRPDVTLFDMPEGWRVVQCVATGVTEAPADDTDISGAMTAVRLLITED